MLAYFNNDWEGYAIRNARRLQELLGVRPYARTGRLATLDPWSTATTS